MRTYFESVLTEYNFPEESRKVLLVAFEKLSKHHFDFSKIWVTNANGAFASFDNNGKRIKLKKRL